MIEAVPDRADALVARFDAWQRKRPRAAFVLAIIRKYNDDEAGHRAALLAYYGFLSIFPFLLVVTTIFRIWLNGQNNLKNQVIQGVVNYFPAVGQELQNNVHALDQTGIALIVGIAITLFGARGVADVLRSSLDHIWQVPHARRSRFPGSLFRSLAIIIVTGLGLAVTPVILGYALAFAHNRTVGLLSPLLTAFVLFWILILIIKIGTSTSQPFKRIWLGSALAVLVLGVLQALGGYIMARQLQRLDSLYGTFALVLGLIFWLYLQTQVLLFALEVDAVRYFRLWPRSLHPPLTDADRAAFKLYSDRARYHDSI